MAFSRSAASAAHASSTWRQRAGPTIRPWSSTWCAWGSPSLAANGSARDSTASRGERDAAIEAALRAAPLWKRPLLRCAAKSVAAVLPLREAPEHFGLHIFQRMRLAAIELGRRLARSGVLADADDVFFLKLAELETGGLGIARDIRAAKAAGRGGNRATSVLAATIEERRRQFADFHARAAPDFVRSDGVPVDGEVESEDDVTREGELRGTGVSRGAASGVARVSTAPIRTPSTPATCWWSRSRTRVGRRSFRARRRW